MDCSTSLACRLSCSLIPSLSAPQSNVKTGTERLEMRLASTYMYMYIFLHGIIAVDEIYKHATILSVYIKSYTHKNIRANSQSSK